jgi:serine/threonine-protein kinase
MQHLSAPPPAPSTFVPDLPRAVDDALLKGLAKNPADRWASVSQFARALAATQEEPTASGLELVSPSGWLGKYELREHLGRGRFGSDVFAGVHRAMGHPVAIRTLRRETHPNWDVARARFLQEAKVLQLSHPSVIQVRDYGEEGDVVYVVTELLEGSSLRQALVDTGYLPWPRLSRMARQLLSAASAIQRRGGLVCGLTPEIIRVTHDDEGERLMVSSGGVCQLQDVMAMLSDSTVRGAGRPEPELYYVAPELLLGQAPDAAADVFTLGAIVYEMATARRPFEATTLPTLLGAMLRTVPADPRAVQPDLPAAGADQIVAALSADPAARPALAELQAVFS